MTLALAIDPGPEKSGIVFYDGKYTDTSVMNPCSDIKNEDILKLDVTHEFKPDIILMEMISSYGMAVGASTFETCVWIGRFTQHFGADKTELIYRRDIRLHLCDTARAKDANIRQAIIDRFPATGGGKLPQVGIKKQPGPLFGMSSHAWSALAIGITYFEQLEYDKQVQQRNNPKN